MVPVFDNLASTAVMLCFELECKCFYWREFSKTAMGVLAVAGNVFDVFEPLAAGRSESEKLQQCKL